MMKIYALIVLFAMGLVAWLTNLEWYVGRDYERDQAIRAGVARYVTNPTTGTVDFEYIKGKQCVVRTTED